MVGRNQKYAPTNKEWQDDYNASQGDNPPAAEEYGEDEYTAPDEEAVRTFGGLWD